MEFNINNAIQIFSMIPSLILSTFFILLSCFNQDIKAFIFLLGIAITFMVNIMVGNITKTGALPGRNPLYCDSFSIPMFTGKYISPYSTSVFLGFTLLYMFMPMLYNSNINPSLLITLSTLILLNAKASIQYSCATWGGVFGGVLIGGVMGWLWFSMLLSMGAGEFLYFGEVMSNKATCSSKKQRFICKMRK
jgi:hypothetical protein